MKKTAFIILLTSFLGFSVLKSTSVKAGDDNSIPQNSWTHFVTCLKAGVSGLDIIEEAGLLFIYSTKTFNAKEVKPCLEKYNEERLSSPKSPVIVHRSIKSTVK